jgi:hypothetical protein
MKLLVIDFESILTYIQPLSVNREIFEIYYDIARLFDIQIEKETCFRLYAKHYDNYGKLKQYLSILGKNVDSKKFDDEFFRRCKQLYLKDDHTSLLHKKQALQAVLEGLAEKYMMSMVAIHNEEFISYMLNFFDLPKQFITCEASQYLAEYEAFLEHIATKNVIVSNPPDQTIFSLIDENKKEIIATVAGIFHSPITYTQFQEL